MATVTGAWTPNATTNHRMRLRVEYAVPQPSPGQTSITVSGSVWVDARYFFYDANNTFAWSGQLPGSGSKSVPIDIKSNDGSQRIHTFSQSVPIGSTATTRSFSFSLTGIDYVGVSNRAVVSGNVPIPARAGDPPTAPTNLQITGLESNTLTATWTGSTDAQRYEVQLTSIAGAWWTPESSLTTERFSTLIGGNRDIQFRVRAWNNVGPSAWLTSARMYTMPAAATAVEAWRKDTTVSVAWRIEATHVGSQRLESHSRTPGGSFDSWAQHSTLTTSQTSISLTGLDNTREWEFRIATTTPDGELTSYSAATNTVGMVGAPSAPTITSPTSLVSTDEVATVAWTHRPTDGTQQESATITLDGSRTLSATVTGTTSSYSLGKLPAGSYTVRVATKGQHADHSAQASRSFTVAAPPRVTITLPAPGGTFESDSLRFLYDVALQGSSVEEVQAELWRGSSTSGESIGSVEITNPTSYVGLIAGTLIDGETYTLRVEVTDQRGLSGSATSTFTARFPRPTIPLLCGDWDDETGAVVLDITAHPIGVLWHEESETWTFPVPVSHLDDGTWQATEAASIAHTGDGSYSVTFDGLTTPQAIRVERRSIGGDWEIVTELARPTVGTPTTVRDTEAPLGVPIEYRAIAISDLGAEESSQLLQVTAVTRSAWLTGLDGTTLSARWNLQVNPGFAHEAVLEQYLGRTLPVAYFGPARPVQVDLKFTVIEEALLDDFRALLGQPVWLRTPTGLAMWAAVVGDISYTQSGARLRDVGIKLEAIEHG